MASNMADGKDPGALAVKSPSTPTSVPPHKSFLISQSILRLSAIVLTAASIAVMVTNSQTITIFTFQFEAHYYYSSALKFLVVADAVVCAFSVAALIIACVLLRREGLRSRGCFFYLFFHDIMMTILMTSGCAAATAIGYVGQYGESHMGWQAICDRVHEFCTRNLISLLLAYLAFFAYLGLSLLTAYKLSSSTSPASTAKH